MTLRNFMFALAAGALLAGCGNAVDSQQSAASLEGLLSDNINYVQDKYQEKRNLEIPPDIVQNERVKPQLQSSSLARYSLSDIDELRVAIEPTSGDVRYRRTEGLRWIEVTDSAENLWLRIKKFWLDLGFAIVTEDVSVGYMETDWRESAENIPSTGVIQIFDSTLGRLYDSGERDKFLTRIERSATSAGVVEIYITHRGVRSTDYTDSGPVRFESRPYNPQLEIIMLKKMMLALSSPGAADSANEQIIQAEAAGQHDSYDIRDDMLLIHHPIDLAYRRTNIALDHIGFSIEEVNPDAHYFHVRYVPLSDADLVKKKDSALGKFFSLFSFEKEKSVGGLYKITLAADGATRTRLSLAKQDGEPIDAATHTGLLELIAQGL